MTSAFSTGVPPMKIGKTIVNRVALATSLVLAFAVLSRAADDTKKDQTDIQKRIEKAADVLNEIMATPDKAIPDKVMADSKCIAVVPSMVKIAVGFGGNHGKG